jgi:hypothetical protein
MNMESDNPMLVVYVGIFKLNNNHKSSSLVPGFFIFTTADMTGVSNFYAT